MASDMEFARRERARKALKNAVRRHYVIKPNVCEECGAFLHKREITAHHVDYGRPYFVKWLCWECHRVKHGL